MNQNQLQDYLLLRKIRSTGRIKTLLYKHNIKQYKCEACGVEDTYNNRPITLQLHHVDGDNTNNRIDNLQILCPNCHSQTQTFRAKKPLTEESILEACKEAKSISEAIKTLKRYPSGALYERIESVIKKFNLPLTKYCYPSNRTSCSPGKQPVLESCRYCANIFEKKYSTHQYCSYNCSRSAACKFQVDEVRAIELVRQIGWGKAAAQLGITSKYPDCNLRLIIKRYIKHNNLDIDIYKLSKFSKHSRRK